MCIRDRDVGEKPYRIDRMLCQLKLSGKLDDAEGFCLGDFTDCESDPDPERPSFSVEEVLNQYFGRNGKPCLTGIPGGHGKYNGCLLYTSLLDFLVRFSPG